MFSLRFLNLFVLFTLLLSPNIAYCFDRYFAWDANTEPDIAGYRIYYKTGVSGAPYDGTGAVEGNSPIDIPLSSLSDPTNPEYALHGLSSTGTFRFVSTAYDIYDNESGYSAELSYQPSAPSANDDSTTVTVISEPPATTLTSLSITGDDSVNESSNADYTATAFFSDGSNQNVTSIASWSENSAYAAINTDGLLTTSDVSGDTEVTIHATYTYNGITETAKKGITITDVIVPGAPISLNALIRVNAGGGEYADGSGHIWSADYGYNTGQIYSTSDPINGTTDDVLYKSERWDPSTRPNLIYSFDLPNGDYTVNLYFAEIYSGASYIGGRVFDVLIEGQLILVNLDIFSEVEHDAALIKTIDVAVTDGQINIEFLKGIENPKISAIEVMSGSAF